MARGRTCHICGTKVLDVSQSYCDEHLLQLYFSSPRMSFDSCGIHCTRSVCRVKNPPPGSCHQIFSDLVRRITNQKGDSIFCIHGKCLTVNTFGGFCYPHFHETLKKSYESCAVPLEKKLVSDWFNSLNESDLKAQKLAQELEKPLASKLKTNSPSSSKQTHCSSPATQPPAPDAPVTQQNANFAKPPINRPQQPARVATPSPLVPGQPNEQWSETENQPTAVLQEPVHRAKKKTNRKGRNESTSAKGQKTNPVTQNPTNPVTGNLTNPTTNGKPRKPTNNVDGPATTKRSHSSPDGEDPNRKRLRSNESDEKSSDDDTDPSSILMEITPRDYCSVCRLVMEYGCDWATTCRSHPQLLASSHHVSEYLEATWNSIHSFVCMSGDSSSSYPMMGFYIAPASQTQLDTANNVRRYLFVGSTSPDWIDLAGHLTLTIHDTRDEYVDTSLWTIEHFSLAPSGRNQGDCWMYRYKGAWYHTSLKDKSCGKELIWDLIPGVKCEVFLNPLHYRGKEYIQDSQTAQA